MSTIDEIRQRAEAATPGPWWWGGNVDMRNLRLSARRPGWGMVEVMTFARWGMQKARPLFANPDRFSERYTNWMLEAEQFAIYEVCPEATSRDDRRVYRGDITGFRHPDAAFIAHAREDVDTLLARIDELEVALAMEVTR